MTYRDYLRDFVAFGILFLLIYFVTAIKPLNKEFCLQTEHSVYLDNEELTEEYTGTFNAAENKAYPFRLKEY
ncbi:MAG: hypothetical protein J6U06_06305, partial [Spirochaetaceae bacterium]|nr:hypothetical protein [Spirochaetaceae bacterium]